MYTFIPSFFNSHFIYCHLYCNGFEVKVEIKTHNCSWAPKSMWMVTAAMKLKMLPPCKKSYDKPRQCIKNQKHHFVDKGPSSQSCDLSSNHVCMWKLDHKEGWASKNQCFWTVVLEKTLESPLDTKIKPVNPKVN